MGRAIIGIIVGYLTLAVVLFILFVGAYFSLGVNGAFKEGVYDPSVLWLVVMFLLGLIAATIAGFVCAAITGKQSPVIALACIAAGLAVAQGVSVLNNPPPDPGPRPASITSMEAMWKAKTPPWVNFANGATGLIGITLGGWLRRQPAPPRPDAV